MIHHDDEPRANAVRDALEEVCGKGLRTYTPSLLVVEKAKGSHLWTADGRKLVDFAAGVLVANLGHNHRGFEKKLAGYAKDMPRNAYNLLAPIEVKAAKKLVKSMKGNPNAQKVLWAASGSEGIQKAIWAAQHFQPERKIILATKGGFHGKKGLAGDITGETSSNPNVRFVPFPMDDGTSESSIQQALDAMAQAHPNDIAMFVTEPYLGARGSYHPPAWYHPMVQAWCQRHGIPFIFDEVQSCHGRTGHMYAFESYGVTPDLVVLGKGLANGEPAAAVVGRADIIDSLNYGDASDTFSGNPRACAAVLAALEVFKEDKIVAHAKKRAKRMGKILADLTDRFPFITAVRGEGLVYGVEMRDRETAERCVLEAYKGTGKKGVHFLGPLAEKVLRVSPPLVIEDAELDEAHGILKKAWKRIG